MSASVELFRALRDHLTTVLGVKAVVGTATGVRPPYVVLWGDTGEKNAAGESICARGPRRSQVGVTCTAATALGALDLCEQVRAALTPNDVPTVLEVVGAHVVLEHFDSRAVQTDRDVVIEATNTHPHFGVELFDAHIQ